MSVAFTPGPWSVALCSQGESCWCRIISLEGHEADDSLETCVIPAGAVSRRDAHLIAAAPELYQALEEALRCVVTTPKKRAKLHAVLAKARGIEAGTGETAKQARSEGRKPGGEATRPKGVA